MFVSKALATSRYAQCKECTEFTALKTCKQCNCFMPVKVALVFAFCPLRKWGPGERDISINEQYKVEE